MGVTVLGGLFLWFYFHRGPHGRKFGSSWSTRVPISCVAMIVRIGLHRQYS